MKENARGHITLRVYASEGAIHILVMNDGRKFSESDYKKGHSMDNIRSRLRQLVNGELKIHFEEMDSETCVEVIIPLNG